MRLLHNALLLMLYSTTVWCTLNRTKRTSQMNSNSQMDLQHNSPEPIICRQPNHRIPWYRRHREQVFAVNEQLIPQPFAYPMSGQHEQGMLHNDPNMFPIESQFPARGYDSIPQLNSINQNNILPIQSNFNDLNTMYPNQPQFPVRGYDPLSQISSVNQNNILPIQPNPNELISLNQQYSMNNIHQDQSFPTQLSRPPINSGFPVNSYPNNQLPNYRYPNNPQINHGANNNQQLTDIDNISKINIDINKGSSENTWPQQNVRHRQVPGINAQNIGNTLPSYSELYNFRPTQYNNVQDTGYPRNTIYTRSVPYFGQNSFPTDLLYVSSVPETVLGNQYAPTNDQLLSYVIDPRVLSKLDEYIQRKIEKNQKSHDTDKQTNNAALDSNSNNQTTNA